MMKELKVEILYQLAYIFQVATIEYVFLRNLDRKVLSKQRILLMALLTCIFIVLIPLSVVISIVSQAWWVLISIISVVYIVIIVDSSFKEMMFRVTGALWVQNLTFNSAEMINGWLNPTRDMVLTGIIHGVVIMIIYSYAYLHLVKKINEDDYFFIDKKQIIGISSIAMSIIFVLQNEVNLIGYEHMYLIRFLFLVCAAMALFIQFGFLDQARLQHEKIVIERLYLKHGENYEQSKANLEFVNVHLHDIKNQLNTLKALNQEVCFEDIERIISKYDSSIKTGNKTLDTILAEKTVLFKKYGIVFTCMMDTIEFNQIKVFDMVSIFGNALDNAIECVKDIEDVSKRFIDLKINKKGNVILVHIENYCETPPVFENGYPVTTKKDKLFHGYGIKSIKNTAQKYGGNSVVSYRDKLFILDVMLPSY